MSTDNVINLADYRDKPEPPFATEDPEGRKMLCFLLSFTVDGRLFSTTFWAYDVDDAYHRCDCMRVSLKLDGQMLTEVR